MNVVRPQLYHFTCADHGFRALGRRGMIRPNYHPFLHQRLAWFTSEAEPDREATGLGRSIARCDRMAYRYAAEDSPFLVPWLTSLYRAMAPPEAVSDLEAYGRPGEWWVSAEPVAAVLDSVQSSRVPPANETGSPALQRGERLMNYYEARQIDPASDRQEAGKWHFTCRNDDRIWPVGWCADGCAGHETAEEAERHFYDSQEAKGIRWSEQTQASQCAICGEWTPDILGSAGHHLTFTEYVCRHHFSGGGDESAARYLFERHPFTPGLRIISSW